MASAPLAAVPNDLLAESPVHLICIYRGQKYAILRQSSYLHTINDILVVIADRSLSSYSRAIKIGAKLADNRALSIISPDLWLKIYDDVAFIALISTDDLSPPTRPIPRPRPLMHNAVHDINGQIPGPGGERYKPGSSVDQLHPDSDDEIALRPTPAVASSPVKRRDDEPTGPLTSPARKGRSIILEAPDDTGTDDAMPHPQSPVMRSTGDLGHSKAHAHESAGVKHGLAILADDDEGRLSDTPHVLRRLTKFKPSQPQRAPISGRTAPSRQSSTLPPPTVRRSRSPPGYPSLEAHLDLEQRSRTPHNPWVVLPQDRHPAVMKFILEPDKPIQLLPRELAWVRTRMIAKHAAKPPVLISPGEDLYEKLVQAHGRKHTRDRMMWNRMRKMYTLGPSLNFISRWIMLCPTCSVRTVQ